jgi:YHS domain-containing protein
MTRFILLFVLLTIAARMFWRFVEGIIEGATGQSRATRSSRAPAPSVPMVRDPVCGTFVLPERAITLVDGRQRLYFCSDRCRDAYRARTA